MINRIYRLVSRKGNRGIAFTLVELLVVIAIIGILLTLTVVALVPAQKKVRDSKRKADLSSFQAGLKLFESDFKVYPNSTMYLGTVSTASAANGDINNNLGLDNEVLGCSGSGVGGAGNFAKRSDNGTMNSTPTTAQLNSAGPPYYTMKPGFQATNHFLVCLKLLDRIYSDSVYLVSDSSGRDAYHYHVSYDYSSYIVTARLETSSDKEGTLQLFPTGSNQGAAYPNVYKYIDGNGKNTRQLDDDTNAQRKGTSPDGAEGSAAEGFYSAPPAPAIQFPTGDSTTSREGKYLYQCTKDKAGALLKLDDRSSPAYAPLVINVSGSWAANISATPSCTSTPVYPDFANNIITADDVVVNSY